MKSRPFTRGWTAVGGVSIVIFVSLATMDAQATPAFGGKNLPPKITLRAGKLEIPGHPWQVTWFTGAEDGHCSAFVADGTPSYDPDPPPLAAGVNRARIVLHSARKPQRVVVRAHHRLGSDGLPAGAAQRLSLRLVAGRRNNEIASWRAIVALRPQRRYYLDVHVAYRGRGRCSAGRGDMDLSFSLLTQGVSGGGRPRRLALPSSADPFARYNPAPWWPW